MSEANGRPDLMLEKPIPLAELSKLVTRKYGIRRGWESYYNYTRPDKDADGNYIWGCLVRSTGQRVILESIDIGGIRHSTEAAYLRFVAKQNEGRD